MFAHGVSPMKLGLAGTWTAVRKRAPQAWRGRSQLKTPGWVRPWWLRREPLSRWRILHTATCVIRGQYSWPPN